MALSEYEIVVRDGQARVEPRARRVQMPPLSEYEIVVRDGQARAEPRARRVQMPPREPMSTATRSRLLGRGRRRHPIALVALVLGVVVFGCFVLAFALLIAIVGLFS